MLKQITDQRSFGYNHDALNCMFQLVAHGHDDAALQVYFTMHGGGKESHNNNNLLRNMVIRGRVSWSCFLIVMRETGDASYRLCTFKK